MADDIWCKKMNQKNIRIYQRIRHLTLKS